jgi:hypothetical protein
VIGASGQGRRRRWGAHAGGVTGGWRQHRAEAAVASGGMVAAKTVRDEVVGVWWLLGMWGKFRAAVQNGMFISYARYIH